MDQGEEEKNKMSSSELKTLFSQVIRQNEEILKQSQSIKRTLRYFQIAGFLKIAIILVPLALGIIYLPPLLQKYYGQFQGIVIPSSVPLQLEDLDFGELNITNSKL